MTKGCVYVWERRREDCLQHTMIQRDRQVHWKVRLTISDQVDELPKGYGVTEATETEGESVRSGREGVGVADLFCCIYLGLEQLIHQIDKQLGLC